MRNIQGTNCKPRTTQKTNRKKKRKAKRKTVRKSRRGFEQSASRGLKEEATKRRHWKNTVN